MASQYSHKHFFRQLPNVQLAQYFTTKDIDLGLDLQALKEKEVEQIFLAFTALPEDQQAFIEAESRY